MAKGKDNSVPNINWNDLLEGFSSGGSFGIWYVKKGRTNVRLLPPKSKEPFVEVTSVFRTKKRTKYLVAGWSKDFVDENREGDLGVRALLLTKTQVRSILSLQVEGWELFDPTKGHPIAIVKTGSGQNTSTNVMPAPKSVEVPEEVMAFYNTEFDMEELGETWTEQQLSRYEENIEAAEDDTSDDDSEEAEGEWD